MTSISSPIEVEVSRKVGNGRMDDYHVDYRNSKEQEDVSESSGSQRSRNNTITQGSTSATSGNIGSGSRNNHDTMSKYNHLIRKREQVIMYKQTRHLKQWKKQLVEYYHDRNMLRFADPHNEAGPNSAGGGGGGTTAAGGKYKEIPMTDIREVSVQSPRTFDIVLPNHYEGYSMIRVRLLVSFFHRNYSCDSYCI